MLTDDDAKWSEVISIEVIRGQRREDQGSACQRTELKSRPKGQSNQSPGVEWQTGH